MAELSVTIASNAVLDGADVTTKREILNKAATVAADCYQLDAAVVAKNLAERESLGSTGFGGAIAIPHAKIAGLEKCIGVFMRLEPPVEYAAYDGRPVDLIFALFSPEHGGAMHLKALAEISRFLRDENMLTKLRGAKSTDAIFALLTGQREQQAA